MHWRQEALRSSDILNHMLVACDALAHADINTEAEQAINKAVEGDAVRVGVTLADSTVWEVDVMSGAMVNAHVDGVNAHKHTTLTSSTLAAEVLSAAKGGQATVLCSEDADTADMSGKSFNREICIVLPPDGQTQEVPSGPRSSRRKVVWFADGRRSFTAEQEIRMLDHFDLVAAEMLCKSSLACALQARACLQELFKQKKRKQDMQAFVSALSMCTNTVDFVRTLERTVLAVTHAERCSVWFIDDDNEEVWAPPTASAPNIYCTEIGKGLTGQFAFAAQENPKEYGSVLVCNEPQNHEWWKPEEDDDDDDSPTRCFIVAPVMTAGKDARPLGLIVATNRLNPEDALTSTLEEEVVVEFTEQDSTFMQWLSDAAGSHLERLQLDVMWMKALLERDGLGNDEGMQDKDRELMQEYYSEDARRTGGRRSSISGEKERTVKTVHNFVDKTDYTHMMRRGSQEGLKKEISRNPSQEPEDYQAAPPHADVSGWEIDYWALTEADEFAMLLSALQMFSIPDNLNVDRGILHRFFNGIKSTYRGVPFHNFQHALSTMHYASKIAQVANLQSVLSHTDLFATIIAALCHDSDHRGFNNAFEMMTRSELALRYNDYSPLENHHCARAFEVAFGSTNCNIFQDLPPELFSVMRKRMIAGILATDMKHHGHHVGLLREFELGPSSDSQSQFLVEVIVHAADISNPFMPHEVATRWAGCLNREFTQQVEMEEKLGLPVTSFMAGLGNPSVAAKSLLGFIDFVIMPLTSSLFRIFPEMKEPKQFLEVNRAAASEILNADKPEEEKPVADDAKKLKLAPKRMHGEKAMRGSMPAGQLARKGDLSNSRPPSRPSI